MAVYPDLDGKAVLITGAAGGLGEALAVGFAAQHCQLVLTDVDEEGLSRVAAQLANGRDSIVGIPANLEDVKECARLVDRALEALGRLDVLVNNAALIGRASLDDITPELVDRVMSVNVRAPLFLAQAAIRHMRGTAHGRIINVSSMAARTGGGYPALACYAASKGAMLAMTKALARAAADYGVLVNAVLPSNIDSPMLWGPVPADEVKRTIASIPLKRPSQPKEVAELVLWLASDASSYVTGANWDINGGWFMT
jgi:NAD(P)-dependent dehydrogenase (short-subunit alcohol dehydrogenase family)